MHTTRENTAVTAPPPHCRRSEQSFPDSISDDLLEILGQSTNRRVIQAHLKKLFAGIHSVQFSQEEKEIVAMRSLDRELVPLKNHIPISTDVEVCSLIPRLHSSFYFAKKIIIYTLLVKILYLFV